ncbi:uncharacterized protein LOC136086131 [Hydra vulgaris]|uniref:Uncharacterized protein LOC136086131 n=1 Tax=Hydra vulgaris TaxID=6087 RepID=A0ABM4CRH9_HYDVU
MIRKEVERKKWRHVAGLENLADIPTRMFYFKQFNDGLLSGSKLLCKEDFYSKGVDRINESRVNIVEAASSGNIGVLIDIKKYSTLNILIMVTGYVNRFAKQFYLRNQDYYEKLSSLLKLFTDKQNVLRLKGRFKNSILNYNKKYPIILRDGQHGYFTVLIFRDAYERVMHHGIEMTLSQVRASYVKNYLKTDTVSKVYVLILTCASRRAAHLELTPDMKIPAFIRALKPFIARRGTPDTITSDNFKTFKSIEVMGKSLVTYEELQTVLYDIGSVINSRPLVYMSEDENEEALTPFHLM